MNKNYTDQIRFLFFSNYFFAFTLHNWLLSFTIGTVAIFVLGIILEILSTED